MKPVMPYVKLHVHKMDDVRFMRLTPALIGRWTQLMMLAGKCDAGGAFVQNGQVMEVEDIALALRCPSDDLHTDLKALKATTPPLAYKNGRGWQLTDYETEQGPDDEEKRRYWRERQQVHRDGIKMSKQVIVNDSQGIVNDSHTTESESESESELKSDIESDSQTDDRILTLKTVAIPPKYRQQILANKSITRATILAAYTSAVVQKKTDGTIKQPAALAGWKLSRCEMPDPIWEVEEQWHRHLPAALLEKLGLVYSGDEKEEQPVEYSGYTNLSSDETPTFPTLPIDKTPAFKPGAEQAWYSAQGQLQMEMPRASFDTWVRDAVLIGYSDGVATIGVPNSTASEWLTSRLTSTVERLLFGILDQATTVRFVTTEDLSGGDTP